MADPRKEMVRAGYDRMAAEFVEWGARVEGDARDPFLADFMELLPPGGSVLDLGCGAGVPSTRRLAETFRVTGADISEVQIGLARENVPAANFVCADVLDLALADASFDGVAAFYSISHIPREEHPRVFSLVRRWLRPGGVFVASLGVGDIAGWTGEWLGVPMFFSSHDAVTNRRLLAEAGLEVVEAEVVTMREPEGDATFLWVICRAEAG
jgi:SAM-dependent methyltransferase